MKPLIDWLLQEAPPDAVALVEGITSRLIDAGVPVWRLATNTFALHPELFARGIIWTRGVGIRHREISHAWVQQLALQARVPNPVNHIITGVIDELRVRLATEASDYQALQELKAEGATDYLLVPLRYDNGRQRGFLSLATDAVGGFTDGHVLLVRELLPALSLTMQLASERAATRGLLEVYLGQNAAGRVLEGAFKRGTGQVIRAVIWYCDLRGFTTLVDQSALQDVVPVLDRYFECVAQPVTAAGGEILKFIGDAMLAIFPIGEEGPGKPARLALDSAVAALAAVEAMSEERTAAGQPLLQIGVALHLGEVMYGNIGASNRLDFTVIGAAVNEVARVEPLCKELKTPLLFTEAIARACQDPRQRSMGKHTLRGVAAPTEIFTLDRAT